MTPYHFTTEPVGKGHCYVIWAGDREVIRSGAFLHERDAARVGKHFAADPDLEAFILNRK